MLRAKFKPHLPSILSLDHSILLSPLPLMIVSQSPRKRSAFGVQLSSSRDLMQF